MQLQHQRTLLDNILKQSPSGICVVKLIWDESGNVVDGAAILANQAAMEIAGVSKDAITKKISQIDPKIIANPLFQAVISILDNGRPFSTQYYLKSKNKWLELGISKMDNQHLIVVFTDITAAKTAQLEVERSAKQLLDFINAAHSGMAYILPVKDGQNNITDFTFGVVNAVFADFAQQQPELMKERLLSDFFPSYRTNGLFDQYKRTYHTGETTGFEKHYTGEGLDAWLDIRCTKVDEGVLVTFTDQTALRKLQIDLENLVHELKRSNESLQEFAYVASHDLQEPLRKIQVFSEQLKGDAEGGLREDNKRILERMVAATHRMNGLIQDLLSYSQLSTKRRALTKVNLKELLQQVLIDLEAAVNEKDAVITAGDLPDIDGDPIQLHQLFQNILSNSLKYSKQGERPVIRITADVAEKEFNGEKGCFYEIKIADNGIGFDPQHAEKIFKVFQRLHSRHEYPGTGIGLAIVQKVVDNHRGFITVESEPEKGATFYVYLPKEL